MLGYMVDKLRAEGKFCIVDVGKEAPKRKESGEMRKFGRFNFLVNQRVVKEGIFHRLCAGKSMG